MFGDGTTEKTYRCELDTTWSGLPDASMAYCQSKLKLLNPNPLKTYLAPHRQTTPHPWTANRSKEYCLLARVRPGVRDKVRQLELLLLLPSGSHRLLGVCRERSRRLRR